jgi:hypothetical protein
MREAQTEKRHIQRCDRATVRNIKNGRPICPEHLCHQSARKLIVSRGNGCVGREDTLLPYHVDVRFGRRSEVGSAEALLKQGEREKGGMAFIQMENSDIGVSQLAENLDSTDSKDRFLAKAIASVTAIEVVRQVAVPLAVFRAVRIQEINWNVVDSRSFDPIPPCPNSYWSPLEDDGSSRVHQLRVSSRIPWHRRFALVAGMVERLAKVALPVNKRNPDHWDMQVSR